VWEFWNGLSWSTVTVTDPSDRFASTGTFRLEITGSTSGWATTTINSIADLYWLRLRITAITGSFTTVPLISRASHDGNRYLPYDAFRRFTSTGLLATASWTLDTISKFDPSD